MSLSIILVKPKRSLLLLTLLCACVLQACSGDGEGIVHSESQDAQVISSEEAQPVQALSAAEPQPVSAHAVRPLRDGLLEFSDPSNRYADTARQASLAYEGRVELATLDTHNAGTFATNILLGPLSAANTSNSVPLNTDHYGVEGALFPGWPIAILSRVGLGHPAVQARSWGTSSYDAYLEEQRKLKFQLPWWDVFLNAEGGQNACTGGGTVTWSNNLITDAAEQGDERSVTWDECKVQVDVGALFFGNNIPLTTEGVWLNGNQMS